MELMQHQVLFGQLHFNQLKNDLKNNKNVDIWMAYNCSYDECSIDHDKIFYYNKEILEKDGFKLHYYYWKNFGDFYGHNNDLVMVNFFNHYNIMLSEKSFLKTHMLQFYIFSIKIQAPF